MPIGTKYCADEQARLKALLDDERTRQPVRFAAGQEPAFPSRSGHCPEVTLRVDADPDVQAPGPPGRRGGNARRLRELGAAFRGAAGIIRSRQNFARVGPT